MAILIIGGLQWILIGLALLVLWYLFAPLFTPAVLKQKHRTRPGRRTERKGWREKAEVIEGKGKVIE